MNYTLSGKDGDKVLYVQYRDDVGNLSEPISGTIRLDEAAGTEKLVTINNGAPWTNTIVITLTIGAPIGTTQMQISNDGGFVGAVWQAFDSRPSWSIVPYGSYMFPRTVRVRVRDTNGLVSEQFGDDIIYDPVPPEGHVSIDSVSADSVLVRLNASDPDDLSGVILMRVGLADDFTQADWEPYSTSKAIPHTIPAVVKFMWQHSFETGLVT